MSRPIRLIFSASFVATAMMLVLLPSAPTTVQAAGPTLGAPADSSDAARWQQPIVSVWSNWNAAICNGAYRNVTGDPAPPLSSGEMQRILTEVIAQLNEKLDGGLTLVDAGTGAVGQHCGDAELPGGISVGWSPLETGIAGMAPLAFDGAAVIGAGVVLNSILVCDNAAGWIEFVMLHEMMHALGIDHSEVPGSIMNERVGCEQAAVIHADDIATLNAHYPASEPRIAAGAAFGETATLRRVHFEETDADLTPAQLIARLAVGGCEARVLAISSGSRFQVYVVGAPAFVNAAFPTSLAAMTPLRYRCAN